MKQKKRAELSGVIAMAAVLVVCFGVAAQQDVYGMDTKIMPVAEAGSMLNIHAAGRMESIDGISVEYADTSYQNKEQGVVTAYRGNQAVWTYTTGSYERVQCSRITALGCYDFNDGVYYLVEDGTVICFDLHTGEICWENKEFLGSASSENAAVVDDNGNLYICGSLQPDLFILSAETGRSVKKIEKFNNAYNWPYRLSFDGSDIEICFEQGPSYEKASLFYSIKDGTISAKKSSSGGMGASVGASVGGSSLASEKVSISAVSASTYLDEPQYGLTHDAGCVVDGNTATAWVEDAAGQGEGEWLKVDFSEKYTLAGFEIYNGHQESRDLYDKNSRVHQLKVSLSDGTEQTFELNDSYGSQICYFDQAALADSVKFTIVSVYGGYKYQDTCISEIRFFR